MVIEQFPPQVAVCFAASIFKATLAQYSTVNSKRMLYEKRME
jgi:hypothetical protein